MGSWRAIALSLIVVALAVRLAVLVVMFAAGAGDVHGHHLETAALMFVVTAVVVRLLKARPGGTGESDRDRRPSMVVADVLRHGRRPVRAKPLDRLAVG